MRATFHLTAVALTLFVILSDAASLRKRTTADAVADTGRSLENTRLSLERRRVGPPYYRYNIRPKGLRKPAPRPPPTQKPAPFTENAPTAERAPFLSPTIILDGKNESGIPVRAIL